MSDDGLRNKMNVDDMVKQCSTSKAYCSSEINGKVVCNLKYGRLDCYYQSDKTVMHGRYTLYYVCEYDKKCIT